MIMSFFLPKDKKKPTCRNFTCRQKNLYKIKTVKVVIAWKNLKY